MGICFVIQPFDRGRFNKRYSDIFEPAITAAGLEPYRVDKDPSVAIPMDDITNGIKRADLCLADITTDNPNVWFELGFAIAANKEVVLVCSRERTTRYPFDVQHRNIIQYETESSSDFQLLSNEITVRIKALIAKGRTIVELSPSSPLNKREGLQPYQIAVLALVLANCPYPGMTVGMYDLQGYMDQAGYTQIASGLAIRYLLNLNYIDSTTEYDYMTGEPYQAIGITDLGVEWLMKHETEIQIYLQFKNSDAR